MGNSSTITHCTISRSDRKAGLYQAEITAELSDGETVKLFSFYDDEIEFNEQELIGLTQRQAVDLFYKRDIEYLRS